MDEDACSERIDKEGNECTRKVHGKVDRWVYKRRNDAVRDNALTSKTTLKACTRSEGTLPGDAKVGKCLDVTG